MRPAAPARERQFFGNGVRGAAFCA